MFVIGYTASQATAICLMPLDPHDGLPLVEVGEWAAEKHERLRKYVEISRAARRMYLGPRKAGATYIDLFCGPGRASVRDTRAIIDGSPVVAWKSARDCQTPFTALHIADVDPDYLRAAAARLRNLEAPVNAYKGPAIDTVSQVTAHLNTYALHFAFLDPYSLEDLPFAVIERLATLRRMDMLIHVSVQDLQRNLRRYVRSPRCPLDKFAPGWRNAIDANSKDSLIRHQILTHWLGLIQRLGTQPAEGIELVTAAKKQPLYWLVLVASHKLAHKLWDAIRNVGPQEQLF